MGHFLNLIKVKIKSRHYSQREVVLWVSHHRVVEGDNFIQEASKYDDLDVITPSTKFKTRMEKE